ncbi:MAG TPA: hypothetical protein VLI04_08635 [Nocardioidaceae bacterium]|nr:hypothetical protein [Nocardioidaceae bacterium]
MTDLLLVTCTEWPDGEPAADVLDRALAARGVDARWVNWDDASVDWSSARVVAVRSTWDYIDRRDDFLAWAARVGEQSLLLNGASVFAWNTDKQYLVELGAAGVPVVPTVSVDSRGDLVPAAASFDGRVVVKPRVGVGGFGLVVVDDPDALAEAEVGRGPWAVQPVIESVRTEGELSVFVLGGQATYSLQKVPAEGQILVHEHHGGRNVRVPLDEDAVRVAKACVAAAEGLLGTTLHYARVDLMRHDGELVVSELEATEPGLYLDVIPENAEPFVDLIVEVLGR